ncbi:sensor histidine kinase [Aurantimonas sp. MSK8Z-1]|uniref:sensor histidine kinase n=1 Tax=Mangrovibrevibacter kandeliae TaxID=2968473 RepID=UPI0021188C96|nr:sensor histidine kinase [Aurantimonas sp. MSK8Z-1]MCW4116193.1 sensor histidine kinase [Aurantimonas sp. MSK8Z-1]
MVVLRTLTLLVLLVGLAACQPAQEPGTLFIGRGAPTFVDPGGSLSPEQVVADGEGLFRPSDDHAANAGMPPTGDAVFWVKLEIPSAQELSADGWTDDYMLSVEEPRIVHVDAFVVRGGQIGQRLSWDGRDRARAGSLRYPAFFLEASEVEGSDIYLAIRSYGAMRASVWLADASHFSATYGAEIFFLALLVGIMTGALIYLVALGANLRDPTNLWLALCLFSAKFYILTTNGLFETYFLPGAITTSRVMALASALLIYCAFTAFTSHFLRIPEMMPRLARAADAAALFFCVLAVLSPLEIVLSLNVWRFLGPLLAAAVILFAALLAAVSARRAPMRSLLYFAAWSPLVLCVILQLTLILLPGVGVVPFSASALYFSIAVSLVSFSIISTLDIQQRERALQRQIIANANRFRAFAEIGTDTFWEVDAQGRITFLSGGRIKGIALERGGALLDRLAEASSPDFAAPLAGAIEARRPIDDRRIRITLTDREHWISISGRPIGDSPESGAAYRGIIKDITLEVERESRRLMEQQMFTLGQMAGSVAHEINNLIHPIINLTKRLRHRLKGDAEIERMFDLIDLSSRQAANVVSALLTTTRSGEKWRNADRPLHEAVQYGIDALQPAMPSSIRIDFTSTEVPCIIVKAGDVLQVLGNLISNSVHAVNGSGSISVTLNPAPDGGARLTVADGGPGMSEAVLRRALEPFFTTKADGGTGVGLYIVQRIMHQYGGSIDIQSATDRGTVVALTFPAGEEPDAREQANRARR